MLEVMAKALVGKEEGQINFIGAAWVRTCFMSPRHTLNSRGIQATFSEDAVWVQQLLFGQLSFLPEKFVDWFYTLSLLCGPEDRRGEVCWKQRRPRFARPIPSSTMSCSVPPELTSPLGTKCKDSLRPGSLHHSRTYFKH